MEIGGGRRVPNLVRLCLVALPYAMGKKEKVVNPRAGFNPKPAMKLGPQATIREMDKYDKSFTPEKTEKKELKIKYGMIRTRHNTRGSEACILSS